MKKGAKENKKNIGFYFYRRFRDIPDIPSFSSTLNSDNENFNDCNFSEKKKNKCKSKNRR